MTLILTIANEKGVHQSSDYQLTTSAGKFVSNAVGTKQLERTFQGLIVRLAFTGVAQTPGRPDTVDWLNDELSSLPDPTDLDTICSRLAHRCFVEVGSRVAVGSKGVLTVVLSVNEIGRPFRVVRISNSDFTPQHFVRQKEFIAEVFSVENGSFFLIDPAPDQLLTRQQKRQLKGLSKAIKKKPKEIMDELAQINAAAAKVSKNRVSEGCWVGSLFQEGEQQVVCQMINFGGSHGRIKTTGSDAQRKLMDQVIEDIRKQNGWNAVGVRQSVTASFVRAPSKPNTATAVANVIASLGAFVGQPWASAAESIDSTISAAGLCYRWLEPTTDVFANEYRPDRINIFVGAETANALTSNLIQSFSVG